MGPPGAIFVVLSLWCGCLLLLVRLSPGRRVPRRRLEAPWSRMGLFGQRRSCVELPAATQLSLGAAQFCNLVAATSRQSSHPCARSLTECSWSGGRLLVERQPELPQRWPHAESGTALRTRTCPCRLLRSGHRCPKTTDHAPKSVARCVICRCSAWCTKAQLARRVRRRVLYVVASCIKRMATAAGSPGGPLAVENCIQTEPRAPTSDPQFRCCRAVD